MSEQTVEKDVLTRLESEHSQYANEGRDSLFGDAATEVRRLRGLVAQGRIDALREAYDLLERMPYEPVNGIYPEGHVAFMVQREEKARG